MLEDFLLKLFRWSPFGIIELVLILLVLLVLIFVFWLIFRRRSSFSPSRPHSGQGPETAMDILKKRYARGEITRTEFEEMKRDIL
jgi:putative membrane protein